MRYDRERKRDNRIFIFLDFRKINPPPDQHTFCARKSLWTSILFYVEVGRSVNQSISVHGRILLQRGCIGQEMDPVTHQRLAIIPRKLSGSYGHVLTLVKNDTRFILEKELLPVHWEYVDWIICIKSVQLVPQRFSKVLRGQGSIHNQSTQQTPQEAVIPFFNLIAIKDIIDRKKKGPCRQIGVQYVTQFGLDE